MLKDEIFNLLFKYIIKILILFYRKYIYKPKNADSSSQKTGSFELNAFINSPCVNG